MNYKFLLVLLSINIISADNNETINKQKKIIINNFISNEKNQISDNIKKLNITIENLKTSKDKELKDYNDKVNELKKLNLIQIKEVTDNISNHIIKMIPKVFKIKKNLKIIELKYEKLLFIKDKKKMKSFKDGIKNNLISILSKNFNKYYEKFIQDLLKKYKFDNPKDIKNKIFTNIVNHYLNYFKELQKNNMTNLNASVELFSLTKKYCNKKNKLLNIECELKLYNYALYKTEEEMAKTDIKSYKNNKRLKKLMNNLLDKKEKKVKLINKYNKNGIDKLKNQINKLNKEIEDNKSKLGNLKNQKKEIINQDLSKLKNNIKMTN